MDVVLDGPQEAVSDLNSLLVESYILLLLTLYLLNKYASLSYIYNQIKSYRSITINYDQLII